MLTKSALLNLFSPNFLLKFIDRGSIYDRDCGGYAVHLFLQKYQNAEC